MGGSLSQRRWNALIQTISTYYNGTELENVSVVDLGRYEDRFFATVTLSSGLLFLAMMFASAAVGAKFVQNLAISPSTLRSGGDGFGFWSSATAAPVKVASANTIDNRRVDMAVKPGAGDMAGRLRPTPCVGLTLLDYKVGLKGAGRFYRL